MSSVIDEEEATKAIRDAEAIMQQIDEIED